MSKIRGLSGELNRLTFPLNPTPETSRPEAENHFRNPKMLAGLPLPLPDG